jgi:hypothetical protein
LTEYIVEQSKEKPENWNLIIGERIEGPYQSLEVANSWAVWFALYDLGLWLLNRNNESAEVFARKVHDELALFFDFINARQADPMLKISLTELSAETAKQQSAHQSYFDAAGFVITLVEPAPIPDTQPEEKNKPGPSKARNTGWKADYD